MLLSIYNQLICFIGCHLPASSPEVTYLLGGLHFDILQDRLASRQLIRQRLAEMYCGKRDVALEDVFHHVGTSNQKRQQLLGLRHIRWDIDCCVILALFFCLSVGRRFQLSLTRNKC